MEEKREMEREREISDSCPKQPRLESNELPSCEPTECKYALSFWVFLSRMNTSIYSEPSRASTYWEAVL
jgi:hypothetical protein